MNKGRNIAILLLCLCCLSLLTFLTTLNKNNTSGVVDNVRYKLASTVENTKEYEFYFIEADMITATLVTTEYKDDDGNVTSTEYSLSVKDYPFTYKIIGDSKKTADIEYFVFDEESAEGKEPFGLYTEEFILSMIYGSKPVLSVTQAIIIAIIAILGGIVLGKVEELWAYFNKDADREFPEYEELKKYKVTGYCILAFSGLLLLIFLIF